MLDFFKCVLYIKMIMWAFLGLLIMNYIDFLCISKIKSLCLWHLILSCIGFVKSLLLLFFFLFCTWVHEVYLFVFFFQIIFVQFWHQGTAGLRQCVWNYSIFWVHIELHVKLLWFIPLMLIFISIVICAIMRRIFTTTVLILEQHRFELCRSIYMGIVLCVCYSTTFLWLVELWMWSHRYREVTVKLHVDFQLHRGLVPQLLIDQGSTMIQ